jgi:hypothetical protein
MRSSKAALGRGVGAQRPVLRGNELKKTGARTRGQNPLVCYSTVSIMFHACDILPKNSPQRGGGAFCGIVTSRSRYRREKRTNKMNVPYMYWGLKTSPFAWTSFKEVWGKENCNFLSKKIYNKKISAVFFQFLAIKTLDLDPNPV